jgi:hypothetical protein
VSFHQPLYLVVPSLIAALSGNDYAPNVKGYGIGRVVKYFQTSFSESNPPSVDAVLQDFIEKAKVEQRERNLISARIRTAAAVFTQQTETLLPASNSAPYATPLLRNPWFQCYLHPTPELIEQYAKKGVSNKADTTRGPSAHAWDHRRIKPRSTQRLFVGWNDEQYKMELDPTSR